MAYALIDWSVVSDAFTVRSSTGHHSIAKTADEALVRALRVDLHARVNERMPAEKLVEVMAAAIFKRVPLQNMAGKEITETPIPDAKVSYITRAEIGPILPDGWYIECQLNRYAACWGDQMTLPARASIAAAILDIQEFLALSVKQANDDLLASFRAQRGSAEMEQLPMWLSSDRQNAAVDASTELDNIA